MKITLLHPSRGRAAQAQETRDNWLRKSSKQHQIEHILGIDSDDPQAQQYRLLFDNDPQTMLVAADTRTVVEATNNIAGYADGSILVYLSDDFACPRNWDQLIINSVKRLVPGIQVMVSEMPPWLLKVNDMLQPIGKDVLTIPIMSTTLYHKLGYFWHPEYRSMFVDQDLFYTVKNMGHLYADESLKFEHMHCSAGKSKNDETYQRSSANWDQGQKLYHRRKAQNFPHEK